MPDSNIFPSTRGYTLCFSASYFFCLVNSGQTEPDWNNSELELHVNDSQSISSPAYSGIKPMKAAAIAQASSLNRDVFVESNFGRAHQKHLHGKWPWGHRTAEWPYAVVLGYSQQKPIAMIVSPPTASELHFSANHLWGSVLAIRDDPRQAK